MVLAWWEAWFYKQERESKLCTDGGLFGPPVERPLSIVISATIPLGVFIIIIYARQVAEAARMEADCLTGFIAQTLCPTLETELRPSSMISTQSEACELEMATWPLPESFNEDSEIPLEASFHLATQEPEPRVLDMAVAADFDIWWQLWQHVRQCAACTQCLLEALLMAVVLPMVMMSISLAILWLFGALETMIIFHGLTISGALVALFLHTANLSVMVSQSVDSLVNQIVNDKRIECLSQEDSESSHHWG